MPSGFFLDQCLALWSETYRPEIILATVTALHILMWWGTQYLGKHQIDHTLLPEWRLLVCVCCSQLISYWHGPGSVNCKKQLGQWALTAALCTRGSSCLWWSHLMSGVHTQSLDPLLVMSLSLSKYENRLAVTHVTLVEQIPSSALGLALSQSRYDL